MDKITDRYNITTFDKDGAPDMLITDIPLHIANSWVEELEADGVDFYIELREEETV